MNNLESLLTPDFPFRIVHKKSVIAKEWENIHAHQGVEFLYIHEGNGRIIIDKKVFKITNNTLVIIFPYQLHKIHIKISEAQPYTRTILIFEPKALEKYFSNFPNLKLNLKNLIRPEIDNYFLRINPGSELHTFFNQICQYKIYMEEEAALKLINLIDLLTKYLNQMGEKLNLDYTQVPHHVELIIDFIENNYTQTISLGKIANQFYLSESYISRLFHKFTGFTITEYVIATRLRKARMLLSSTLLPISEICEKTGISSSSYFSQLFRKYYEISPSEYRKSFKNY